MPSEGRITGAGFLLALAAAFVAGCGEQATPPTPTAPPVKQEAVKLTPEQKFAETLKKAEAGNADAQFKLGEMYEESNGVAEDRRKGRDWIQKAADQGNTKAINEVADWHQSGSYGVRKDKAKAYEWYKKAAEQGDGDAQIALADMYESGESVPKDAIKARDWRQKALDSYQKAAEQGDGDAQIALADMYESGESVPKDAIKARDWRQKALDSYQKAAEQGSVKAHYRLSGVYSYGRGVPKDESKAFEWLNKAAEHGDAVAQDWVADAYSLGKGVPKDDAKAMYWWLQAAAQGRLSAMSWVGSGYTFGRGVTNDRVLAYGWLNIAASKGDAGAAHLRGVNEAGMLTAELSEAQRLSSGWKRGQILVREGKPATVATSSPSGTPTKQGAGTAFLVSKTGQAITNHHVIDGCREIKAAGREGAVKVITSDTVNDLALLQIPGVASATATITSDPAKLRQGEDIVAFGFPLNAVLSSGGNLTPGVVSALTGLGNNTNQIQITAPIQPGSSGSPVLNKKGEVVGVVSMKLSDSKMAKATGQVGQTVNFAVNGQTLKSFLDAHKVTYDTGSFFSREKGTADLADEARKWTLVVECWK